MASCVRGRADPNAGGAATRLAAALVCSIALHALLVSNLHSVFGVQSRAAATPLTLIRARLQAGVQVEAVSPTVPALHELVAPEPAPKVRNGRPRRPAMAPNELPAKAATVPDESAVGQPSDPIYYAARQLDTFPRLQGRLDLGKDEPDSASSPVARVLLLVMINATGVVDDVSVVEAEPAGPLPERARSAFLTARFSPAMKDGRPVRSRVLVQLNYGIEDNAAESLPR